MPRTAKTQVLLWRSTLRLLAAMVLLASACAAWADDPDCDIPASQGNDKPYNAVDVITSFKDFTCTAIELDVETVFYRYYSYPESPAINIGRFLTENLFTLNSEAIVQLALYPFPPNVQYQNFAYYREIVTVKAGITLYAGVAGPQPVGDAGSCYAGGASQFFFADANISSNPDITFSNSTNLTIDKGYVNQYGFGDPCNVIPVPATWPLLAVGLLLLVRTKGHRRVRRRQPSP